MIGIVFSNDLNTCPYIDKYLDVFHRMGTAYEVILWNREGRTKTYPSNYRVYDVSADIYVPKWKKIGGFYGFRKFLRRTIKENSYDKLIFLTTFSALMCYGLTRNQYRGKYIFDFRDLSFEQNRCYRKLVKNVMENSYFTCMSSPGFAGVFQIKNYVMAHNFRYKDIEKKDEITAAGEKLKEKITLLHIGITRGEAYNKRLADVFGNDERFEVYIVGSGNDTADFQNYIEKYDNITVKGTYDNEEKVKLIAKADMLLYYYPCDFNCNRALANKYYDGLIYKKPLIGNKNTYSGRRLQKKGLGISLDLTSESFADEVSAYYKDINLDLYEKNVQKELKSVISEDEIYIKKIEEFAIEKNC
ncbi:MAG: glycosyltransferase family 4 protein [Lachnospiraceae bacterium]|nr:glycosyltransferase family 4 protein [Lachnospiraceae bacterium]